MDDRKKSENPKGNAEQSKPAKPSKAKDMDFCDYASLDPGPSTSKPALRIVDDIDEYIVDEEDDLEYEEDEQADDCNDDFDGEEDEADLADYVEDDKDDNTDGEDEPNKVKQEEDSKAKTGPAWPLKQTPKVPGLKERNLDQHLKYLKYFDAEYEDGRLRYRCKLNKRTKSGVIVPCDVSFNAYRKYGPDNRYLNYCVTYLDKHIRSHIPAYQEKKSQEMPSFTCTDQNLSSDELEHRLAEVAVQMTDGKSAEYLEIMREHRNLTASFEAELLSHFELKTISGEEKYVCKDKKCRLTSLKTIRKQRQFPCRNMMLHLRGHEALKVPLERVREAFEPAADGPNGEKIFKCKLLMHTRSDSDVVCGEQVAESMVDGISNTSHSYARTYAFLRHYVHHVFYFRSKYKSAKTVLLRKKLNEAKCVGNEETDDDSATARLLSAAFGPFQQCEPTLLSADVEVTILSMYPACLLDLLIDKNLLREERRKAMDAINRISQRVRAEAVEGKRETDFGAGNYIMFANVNARHIIELLNWVFYAGMTCNTGERRKGHLQCAHQLLPQTRVDSFIQDAYWANGTRVAIHEFFPAGDAQAPTEAAQFVESILILFFQHSNLNQNRRRGTLKKADTEVSHFSELELTRMGAAVALDQLNGRDSDSFTSYSDVSAYRKEDQTPQPGQHYSTFLKKNIKERNAVPQPPPSAFTEFPRTIPAGLSLLDCPLDPKLNAEQYRSYAMHLFKAYFSIPPKMARWFLFRENAKARFREISNFLRMHDVACSIMVVLQNVPTTLEDCVIWAAEQFLLLFQTNAQIAAEHNTDPKRKITPLELDMTDEWTQIFVYRAAQLYARMWSIADQESGKPPTTDKLHQVYTARTREPKLICKDNRAPYHPITRYDELGYVSEAIDDPTKWQDQDELGHLCDKLKPLDFAIDDQEMMPFFHSILVLRTRILGICIKKSSPNVVGTIMSAPYFERAHLFPQYV